MLVLSNKLLKNIYVLNLQSKVVEVMKIVILLKLYEKFSVMYKI